MNKTNFNKIKSKATSFKHSSFTYVEYEDVADYDLRVNNIELILLLGYNKEAKTYEYIWAANDVNTLIDSLKCKDEFIISFIPREWVDKLKNAELDIRNVWHDYFIDNLDDVNAIDNFKFDYLALSEINEASDITLECRNQSRGFTGQTPQWFREWLNNDEVKDTAVLVLRTPADKISGLVCVGVYGHEIDDGPVVWIREAAVKPEYQNKGLGRKLVSQALAYGKQKGAKKAFLAVDEDNTNAIRLYKSFGFTASKGDSEITMIKC